MSGKPWLFSVVARAALAITAVCFGVALFALRLDPSPTRSAEIVLEAIITILPAMLAAYWMFRKLQARYPMREALSVAAAFGVTAPVALGLGLLLGQIPGGYVAFFLGKPFRRMGAFAGVVLGVWVITTFLSFLVVLAAFWLKRHPGS
jgi:hypothetical protein